MRQQYKGAAKRIPHAPAKQPQTIAQTADVVGPIGNDNRLRYTREKIPQGPGEALPPNRFLPELWQDMLRGERVRYSRHLDDLVPLAPVFAHQRKRDQITPEAIKFCV